MVWVMKVGRDCSKREGRNVAAWTILIFVGSMLLTGCGDIPPLTTLQIFSRAVLSRGYEQNQYVLRQPSRTGPDRETPAEVGEALAGLKPTYVSGSIYLENGTTVNPAMIAYWQTIRTAVLAKSPNAKFDVEISLNPNPPAPKKPFASAAALVAMMTKVDTQLHPDAWWFDFYAPGALNAHPDWISAAVAYAHSHGQLIGGNVFGSKVPPGSDAVAFVDDPSSTSQSGFPYDFSRTEVAALRSSSPTTLLVGHLQSNAQNGQATESCVYINDWTESQRASYLTYWAQQQYKVGFAFMYPVFYPLCPGAYAFDPLQDRAADGGTLYTAILGLMSQYNDGIASIAKQYKSRASADKK